MKSFGLFLMLWMMFPVSDVSAANIGYGVQRLPIVTEDDKTLGWVQVDRQESKLAIDFDLDQPVSCKLTKVETHIRLESGSTQNDYRIVSVSEIKHSRSFDMVRDAQISIDLPNSEDKEISYFSSKAQFKCDEDEVEAWVEKESIVNRIRVKIDQAWDKWRWTRPMTTKGPTDRQTYWVDNAWNDWIWE